MMQCWALDPADRPNAKDVLELLKESEDLITPCLCEPLASIAHEDMCRARIPAPQSPALNMRNGSNAGQSVTSSLDIMSGLGNRLRASFSMKGRAANKVAKNFSNFREIELGMQAADCSSMGRRKSSNDDVDCRQDSMLEASNNQRSTISVISSTFNYSSSCTSLDHLPIDNSTANVRSLDSGSSSGVECNHPDGYSPNSTGSDEVIRKLSTEEEPMFGGGTTDTVQELWHPVGANPHLVTMDDDLPLIPEKMSRSNKRSRSRSDGYRVSCNKKPSLKPTTSVGVTLPEDLPCHQGGFTYEDNTTFV